MYRKIYTKNKYVQYITQDTNNNSAYLDYHVSVSIWSPTHLPACFTVSWLDIQFTVNLLIYPSASPPWRTFNRISIMFAGCRQHTWRQHEHDHSRCCELRFDIPGNCFYRPFWTQSAALRLFRGHDTLADGTRYFLLPQGPHRHQRRSVRLASTGQLRRLRYWLLVWIWSNPVAHDGRDLTRCVAPDITINAWFQIQ